MILYVYTKFGNKQRYAIEDSDRAIVLKRYSDGDDLAIVDAKSNAMVIHKNENIDFISVVGD